MIVNPQEFKHRKMKSKTKVRERKVLKNKVLTNPGEVTKTPEHDHANKITQ